MEDFKQKWIISLGRLRMGYMGYKDWCSGGWIKRNWFFIAEKMAKDDGSGYFTNRAIQMTILGFQIGYMYRGTPSPPKGFSTSNNLLYR